jgi:tRNA(Ile)-lysidine synthase
MDLLTEVRQSIRQFGLLRPGEKVIAAVSGGADSLCLLDVLRRLGYPLVVAHLDHGLRPESADEARVVAQVAERLAVDFVHERQDVGGGPGLEARARKARYLFLARVAREQGATKVATGHTADDQAETVLMHMIRGAGPGGLAGMRVMGPLPYAPGGATLQLIRPLLGVRRSETEVYCRERELPFVVDPSNLDPRFLRNRIRLRIIPALEALNPHVVEALTRLARLAAEQQDLIGGLVQRLEREALRQDGAVLRVHRERLMNEPVALQRELLRRLMRRLAESQSVDFNAVDTALRAARGELGSAWRAIGAGVECALDGAWILMRRAGTAETIRLYPQMPTGQAVVLPRPGRVALAGGWWLECREVMGVPKDPRVSPWRAYLALPRPGAELRLRRPRTGDRIRPLGMEGRVKLSDLFTNEKIPQWARRGWPVVESEGQILWVVGLRVSEAARLRRRAQVVELYLGGPESGLRSPRWEGQSVQGKGPAGSEASGSAGLGPP